MEEGPEEAVYDDDEYNGGDGDADGDGDDWQFSRVVFVVVCSIWIVCPVSKVCDDHGKECRRGRKECGVINE